MALLNYWKIDRNNGQIERFLMRFVKTALIGGLLACLCIIGCGEKQAETDTASGSAATTVGKYFNAEGVSVTLSDSTYTVAGVAFNPPAEWRDEGQTSMRKAQLAYGPVGGETDSATMVVFYFGPSEGGAAQANITRWIGQMVQPDGSPSADKATQYETELGGMKASVVEVTGNYAAGGMGMGTAVSKDGYLMVAVVLEGPEGSLFYKLTGPEKTAAKMAGEFASMMEKISCPMM